MNQIGYLALGQKKNPSYGVLSQAADTLFTDLRKFLTDEWSKSSGMPKNELRGIEGCLDKLSSFLMQAYRMNKYHDELVSLAGKFNKFGDQPLPIVFSISKLGREELTDFESLILQGRATLDRLTWYVSRRFKQNSSSFSHLNRVLRNAKQEIASQILEIIEQADYLKLSLIDPGNPETLRDFIAHKAALREIMENCFTIYYLGANKAILTDCEAGLPIFRTTFGLATDLSFVVLNSLAILLGFQPIGRGDFSPPWILKTVVISDFVSEEDTGFALNVTKRMTPSGFEGMIRNIKKDILQFSIELDPGPNEFEIDLQKPI